MKNKILFRNVIGGGYFVLLLSFSFVVNGQIYKWSSDNLDPQADSRITDCLDLPLYYNHPDYDNHSSALDNSLAAEQPLKFGQEPIMLGKKGCGWQYGSVDLSGNYNRIRYLHPSIWSNSKKYLLFGDVLNLTKDIAGFQEEYEVMQYRGNQLFFDFPVTNQIKNTFYKLKIKLHTQIIQNYSQTVKLALNKDDVNNQHYPWIQGENLLQEFIEKNVSDVIIDSDINHGFIEFPFQIIDNLYTDEYDYQIGLLNTVGVLDQIVSIDEIILDCDDKNIAFDFQISKCGILNNNDCNVDNYCVQLTTNCTNVNFDNFLHYYLITNSSTLQTFTVQGQGEITRFSMDNSPAGNYTIQIIYDDTNGLNEKVAGNYLFEHERNFTHTIETQFYIYENTEFNNPVYLPKDLVVVSPAILTVKDVVSFATNTNLILQPGASPVVLGTGHLTACNNQWEGVVANGHSNVVVRDNGTISFAKTGIYIPGNNGHTAVTLNRAHFINNTIGLHGKQNAAPLIELSYFTEGQTGVLLDNVTGGTAPNGVYFRGNEFAFMSREGILAYNTPIQVEDGNEFSYCFDGIALRNLFASNEQSYIGEPEVSNNQEYNLFENNQNAVYTNGTDVNIENNTFLSNKWGGFYSGLSMLESKRNDYSGYNGNFGEWYLSTGSNSSYSEKNQYSSNIGINTSFENDRYAFLANCFNTLAWDMFAVNGSISKDQGNLNIAASNCFTGGVPDFVCNTTEKVFYFTPDPMVAHPVCLDPVFVSNYEIKDFATTF
ncbi:MAG: hypothetical protein IPI53_10005 [Saprospiraceae bacterium]|nr:hypothetical protein [Saprospiraceae bacterium]